jgi:hypothetical protein
MEAGVSAVPVWGSGETCPPFAKINARVEEREWLISNRAPAKISRHVKPTTSGVIRLASRDWGFI